MVEPFSSAYSVTRLLVRLKRVWDLTNVKMVTEGGLSNGRIRLVLDWQSFQTKVLRYDPYTRHLEH